MNNRLLGRVTSNEVQCKMSVLIGCDERKRMWVWPLRVREGAARKTR